MPVAHTLPAGPVFRCLILPRRKANTGDHIRKPKIPKGFKAQLMYSCAEAAQIRRCTNILSRHTRMSIWRRVRCTDDDVRQVARVSDHGGDRRCSVGSQRGLVGPFVFVRNMHAP